MTALKEKKYGLLALIAGLAVLFDQASKVYIDYLLPIHGSIEVVENFFHIVHVRNTGVAFGILAAQDRATLVPFFVAISLLAVGVVLYLYAKTADESTSHLFALALILGGALGNLIDRIRLNEVIDFLDVHWYQHHWPAFNLADSCITVGVGLFILANLQSSKPKAKGAYHHKAPRAGV